MLYVSVTGSKMYESLYPSYPCPPATGNALLPLSTSTRPSCNWMCPEQNMSFGVGITLYVPATGSYTALVNVPASNCSSLFPEPAISSTLPLLRTTECIERTGFCVGSTSQRPFAHCSAVAVQVAGGSVSGTWSIV